MFNNRIGKYLLIIFGASIVISGTLPQKGYLYILLSVITFSIMTYFLKTGKLFSNGQLMLVTTLAILSLTGAIAIGYFFPADVRLTLTLVLFLLLEFLMLGLLKTSLSAGLISTLYMITPYIIVVSCYAISYGDPKFKPLALIPLIALLFVLVYYNVNRLWRWFGLGLLVVACFFSGIFYRKYLYSFAGKKMNEHVEKFSRNPLISEAGDTLALSEFKGKILVLDFWFSKCQPCFKAFPEVQSLSDHFKNDSSVNVSVVNLKIDGDSVNTAFKLLNKYSFNKFKAIGDIDVNNWEIEAFPTTLVFDSKGNLRYKGILLTTGGTNNIYELIGDLKKE